MNDKENLGGSLNRPSAPTDLEHKIRTNWQNQLEQSEHTRKWMTPIAVAASIAIIMLTLNLVSQTPKVVNAALDDILSDARLNVGISIPMEDILKTHNIHLPEQTSEVRMTKNCRLNGYNTTHMQLTNADQSEIHLFIYHGELPRHFWQSPNGEIGNMPWKLITPRKDLSVLVLQTPGANAGHVESMIQHMFVG